MTRVGPRFHEKQRIEKRANKTKLIELSFLTDLNTFSTRMTLVCTAPVSYDGWNTLNPKFRLNMSTQQLY